MPQLAPSLPHAPAPRALPAMLAFGRQDEAVARPIVVLIPLLIVFYALLLLPPETEFSLFGVRFYGYRLGVIFGMIPALWMTIKDARGFLNRVDLGIALMSFWIALSFMAAYGLGLGFVRAFGIVIDTGGAYFVARASIVTPNDLRRFLILILPGLVLAGAMMAIESISGRLLVRPFATSLFGQMSRYSGGEAVGSLVLKSEFRAGFLRSYGPFDHPILGGAIMTGFMPLYVYSGLRKPAVVLGVLAAICGLFSLSSAAFLGVILMLGAIAISAALPYIPRLTWWTVIAMIGALLLALHLSSTNGIVQLLSRLTFSPETAYYRIEIWRYGMLNIEKHPLFGIGYAQWERASWMIMESIDAHFLYMGMRYGLIVPILLLAGIFFGMARIGRLMNDLDPLNRKLLLGLNISVFVYVIIGQTVTYFSAGGVVFMSFVGFLASLASWSELRVRANRQIQMMWRRQQLYQANPPAGRGRPQAEPGPEAFARRKPSQTI
jgi:O-antigen ligase